MSGPLNLDLAVKQIIIRQGPNSRILASGTILSSVEGEPFWTTDTHQLHISIGNTIVRVPTQDSDGYMYVDGELEVLGSGIILSSPDSTRWLITVDDSGNLVTTSL